VLGNVERVREGRLPSIGVRDRGRRRVWGELEDGPRGEVGRVQRWAGAGHGERVALQRVDDGRRRAPGRDDALPLGQLG
jgi:hypothetical protein